MIDMRMIVQRDSYWRPQSRWVAPGTLAAFGTVALLAISGCTSFTAVVVVGKTGEKLEAHAPAVAIGRELCDEQRAILLSAGINEKACDTVEKQAESWSKAATVVAGYAKALKALAEADDPKVDNAVDGIIESFNSVNWSDIELSEDKAAGISTAVNKLALALTKAYRKKELKEAVEAADPAVQDLDELWNAHIATRLDDLKDIDIELNRGLNGKWCPATPTGTARACTPMSSAERMVIAKSLEQTRVTAAELRAAAEAMTAFAKAHAKLLEKFKSGDVGDTEALKEIFEVLKAVHDASTTDDSDAGTNASDSEGKNE